MDYDEVDLEIPFDDISLTDLIETETLQKIQDAFSELSRMAALTTDADGLPVTRGSNFSRFCTEFCRRSDVGRRRCEQCDINGAHMALKKGGPVSYYCHANLVDFAAPIMLKDRVVGSFIGGQVLSEPPDLKKMSAIAKEIGVDEGEFLAAALGTNIVPKSEIDRAAQFIYSFSQIMSDIAYRSYVTKFLSEKALSAATAKSDFLANMSHEIRTPMNAVLGMARIALRENLPPAARDSINQIVTSGKLLLTIINDILDYSKIEAGKVEIVEEPYDPLSLVNDLSGVALTKLGDRMPEFIVDANPDFPREVLGDSIRIKQVITNLTNNAVKFTREGMVCLHLDFRPLGRNDGGEEIIELRCAVEDTGIGIKDEDKAKLFKSFQQVDTKRNRHIEGSGLGLAISKNFLELMGGEISVESEYGKGSTFSFTLPQTVKNADPCFRMDGESFVCGAIVGNTYVLGQLEKDLKKLGQTFVPLDLIGGPDEIEAHQIRFLFIDQPFFSEKLQEYVKGRRNLTAVVLVPLGSDASYPIRNVRVVQKPLYVLNLAAVLKNTDVEILLGETRKEDLFFTAPDADILLVDDSDVNLTVARGLLAPLQMNIDTALSGRECLEKITKKRYDIIFMDHMMPGMDGVETTVLIRRGQTDCRDAPIIALTANVLAETKEMFFQSGMNDFVAKPIEMKVIVSKIKQWLPAEKVIPATDDEIKARESAGDADTDADEIEIEGLDTEYALSLLGRKDLFWEVLRDWYRALPKKIALIEGYCQGRDWKSYTIEVHALKSSSRQIGALKLSKLAEELEAAGKVGDTDVIVQNTDALLSAARGYIPILSPFFKDDGTDGGAREKAAPGAVAECLAELSAAFACLDVDGAEKVVSEMKKYEFSGEERELFGRLLEAVECLDSEGGAAVVARWQELLSGAGNGGAGDAPGTAAGKDAAAAESAPRESRSGGPSDRSGADTGAAAAAAGSARTGGLLRKALASLGG